MCSNVQLSWRKNSWQGLLHHATFCAAEGCQCRFFLKHFESYSKRLPLIEMACSGQTWLWFSLTDDGRFAWSCLACHHHDEKNCGADGRQKVQICDLLTHHTRTTHNDNVRKMLRGAPNHPLVEVSYTAPSRQLFKELFGAFHRGCAPTSSGFDLPSGVLGKTKANSMLWCLDQGLCDIRREFLAHSECINALRDERHNRMHVRVLVGPETDDASQAFYLGQSRFHRPDAIGIADATVTISKNACTSRAHPPPDFEATPHEDIFHHVRRAVEATSVDSAENEIVACRDMSTPKPDGSEADFPNANHLFRDAAHSARRLLSRLFVADKWMEYVFNFFMVLCSIVQWSGDMRTLYAECTSASFDAAVSTTFTHMRAAKHRIESYLTPLSRCCLDPTGEHY